MNRRNKSHHKATPLTFYPLIILAIYIFNNIILRNLIMGGILYYFSMALVIATNIATIVTFRKEIKCKYPTAIILFFIWPFAKDILQFLFAFSSMMAVMAITDDHNFAKATTSIAALFYIASTAILSLVYITITGSLFTYLLTPISTLDNKTTAYTDVYDDMHYYCAENYEIYAYSAGAMDSFHYSVSKYYDLIDIDNLIYVIYHKRHTVSPADYNKILKTHNCKLANQ